MAYLRGSPSACSLPFRRYVRPRPHGEQRPGEKLPSASSRSLHRATVPPLSTRRFEPCRLRHEISVCARTNHLIPRPTSARSSPGTRALRCNSLLVQRSAVGSAGHRARAASVMPPGGRRRHRASGVLHFGAGTWLRAAGPDAAPSRRYGPRARYPCGWPDADRRPGSSGKRSRG